MKKSYASIQEATLDYQKHHWMLLSSTNDIAQLHKHKKAFSCLPNLIWTLIAAAGLGLGMAGIVPGFILMLVGVIIPVIYFFGWLFGRDRYITLFLDEHGIVKKQ